MRVTMRDIARRLSISRSTVSRVLNNKESRYIGKATRELVWATANELGYVRNEGARALSTGRTYVIGVWVPVFRQYFIELVDLVEPHLRADGYELAISHMGSDGNPSNNIQKVPVDGIIVIQDGKGAANLMFVGDRRLNYLPCVSIAAELHNCSQQMQQQNIDTIWLDLYHGSRRAMQHLIGQGCKRVAFCSATSGREDDGRRQAYKEVIAESGLEPQFILARGQASRGAAWATIKEYLSSEICPDAILCVNDDTAIGVIRGLNDLGIRVPDDVAVVGCDGISDGNYLGCPLSTMVLPKAEICALAWEYLHSRIEEPEISARSTTITADFIIRKSSTRNSKHLSSS